MVIGKPWEDPQRRPEYVVDLNTGTGDEPEPDDQFLASDLDDDLDAGGSGKHELRVGPEGIDDPETDWEVDDAPPEPLPELSEDEIWVLIPGEELMVTTSLPKPRHMPCAIAIRPGEIAVCSGRRREWCRTPLDASDEDASLPMAHSLRMVFIRHRASGVRTKPRKYVIVTDEDEAPLGWLDYSDLWNFENGVLRRMVDVVGVRYEVERFTTEAEFEAAHPDWVG